MISFGRVVIGIIAAASFSLVLIGSALSQDAAEIPWRQGTISIHTDDDVKEILRNILRSSNLLALFKGKVSGEVSVDEDEVPARGLFNQLIAEHDLKYKYSAETSTVTISPKVAEVKKVAKVVVRRFLHVNFVQFPVIRSVLETMGLGTKGVIYDESTRTIGIQGFTARVTEIETLIRQLDEAEGERQNLTLQKERAEFEAEIYRDALNARVKVIRLRYASVGATTKSFQGKEFQVPGIEETLQSILGVQITKSGQSDPLLPRAASSRTPTQGGQATAAIVSARNAFALEGLRRPRVSVDRRTNSVIVRGSPKAIAEVQAIIRDLDVPLRMIEIEMVLVTAGKNVTEELGLALRGGARRNRQRSDRFFSSALDSGTTGTAITMNAGDGGSDFRIDPDAISLLPTAFTGNSGLLGTFLIGGANSAIQAQIRAFADDTRTQVMASPKIISLDNVAGRISRSQNLFISIPASGDNGQDLEEVTTGLTIDILPSIIPSDVAGVGDLIRLSLNAENTSPTALTVGGVTVTGQKIQTEVLVPDGATYVMGGLFDDTRTESEAGLPILKDIPLLGRLFRTDASSDNVQESIFFITPRIIDESQFATGDIAIRVGTREYMKRQRQSLSKISGELESAGRKSFPDSLRMLREDE